jgi:Protein of unknown function (DUF1573)
MCSRVLGVVALVVTLLSVQQASAQNWVSKMLAEKDHDFGTVARGADTVFKFPVKNIYKQDVELISVRSSCGCTSPSLEHKVLKTGETGYVVAKFNTRTFDGVHSATLTVTVQWNDNGITRTGEAQLHVHGNIRSDVVFQPGAIKFDGIDQGSKSEQQVRVKYAGRSDWKITDVRGASDDLEVELTEVGRQSNTVTYELLVRMKDTAPAGYFNEQLVLVTNDGSNPRIPLHVEGRVIPQISVAPEALRFGDVTMGATVPMKVLVRGKQPFKITSVESPSGAFEFKTDEESSPRHVVEVVFAGKENPGPVKETIHITTDLGESFDATLTAYATVVPPATETPAADAPAAEAAGVTSTPAEGATTASSVAAQ